MIPIQTITAKASTAKPREGTFSLRGDQKIPRARNELPSASKAPNKIRRPCCAKISLKRKRENPKRPPATMSRMLNCLEKPTTECNQDGGVATCSSATWIVATGIQVRNTPVELEV